MYIRNRLEGISKKRGLRRGLTTGTCAAAASKAATIAFLSGKRPKNVEVALPSGQTVNLPVHSYSIGQENVVASIIKDAGDDPDVTNGAEIKAAVSDRQLLAGGVNAFRFTVQGSRFTVLTGKGIGIVTKPGLAVPIGEPAINPVPRKMIKKAVRDVISQLSTCPPQLSITISVPKGEDLAKKTMNARLGIIGGISILGTTGIVEPLSISAYRHSIICSLDVAVASGCSVILLSTGRSSEKVAQRELNLLEEACILVGDHMGFALREVAKKGKASGALKKVIIAGQFGKFSKLASGHFETHCKDSSVELEFLAGLAEDAGAKRKTVNNIIDANTAREVFFVLQENRLDGVFNVVCERIKKNARAIVGSYPRIGCILVGYFSDIKTLAI